MSLPEPPSPLPSVLQTIDAWPAQRILEQVERATVADVDAAIAATTRDLGHLAALLSPAAIARLEAMAQEAHRLTRWQFGRTIGLYVPIYLSNVCGADCVYCGYAVRSADKSLRRYNLSDDALRRECEALAAQGFQDVLLLTGEAPKAMPVEAIAHAVDVVRGYFPSVAVEIYALEHAGYEALVAHGTEGVTLYQETYERDVYGAVHLLGRKQDYDWRLEALERAGRAGVRRLSVGALLGLYDWRCEAFRVALHARHLQQTCWRSEVSVSFPRLSHVPERFQIPRLVTDRELVQMMLALRLFLPQAGFNLSTRERPALRDRLIPLGVTMMSAGSSTRPGGYTSAGAETLAQFEIEDARSAAEVASAIRHAGYDPVWKNFDHAFAAAPPRP